MKFRLPALLVAAAVAATAAVAAPVHEPAIQVTFPDPLGGLSLTGRTVFPEKGAGVSIVYERPGLRGAVYVYDAGVRHIPNGVGNTIVQRHFMEATQALGVAVRERPEAGTPRPIGSAKISAFPGCGPQFLWRAFVLDLGGTAMTTRTYVTGLNGQFVKLRISYRRDDTATERAAEQFVGDIRRILGGCS